jgi:hypothetical protein
VIDKLGSLSQVLLRLQQGRAAPAAPVAPGVALGPAQAAAGALTLEQRILRRVAALDPDDPRRRQQAFRAFIELRLLDEFGQALVNDAGFQQLVDDVIGAMSADESLRREMESATDLLLSMS